MRQDPDVEIVAVALQLSIGLLLGQIRQAQAEGELTSPEISALARLDRSGPATASALAKLEHIRPQSMGATLAALEARGLVERRRDPDDGRRVVMSLAAAGQQMLRNHRTARTARLAEGLSAEFSALELGQLMTAAPLIERLAQRI